MGQQYIWKLVKPYKQNKCGPKEGIENFMCEVKLVRKVRAK